MASRRPLRVPSYERSDALTGRGTLSSFRGRVVLLELRCGRCSHLFHVCRPDYRGHRYCSRPCAQASRKRKVAEYDARYRASYEGKLNRADLERERRRRLREADRFQPREVSRNFVDDHSSPAMPDSASVTPPLGSTDESALTPEVSHVSSSRRPTLQQCIVCGRHSHYVIPFGEPLPRRRHRSRGPP